LTTEWSTTLVKAQQKQQANNMKTALPINLQPHFTVIEITSEKTLIMECTDCQKRFTKKPGTSFFNIKRHLEVNKLKSY